MPDHVHVVASIPPSVAISLVVGRMKGASAHALNAASPTLDVAWQAEYGVLSFGERALNDVIAYAEHQSSRHSSDQIWERLESTAEPS